MLPLFWIRFRLSLFSRGWCLKMVEERNERSLNIFVRVCRVNDGSL